jgi:hypothetical protein
LNTSRLYPTFLAFSLLLNTPATAQVLDLPNATIEELRSALALGKINSRLLVQITYAFEQASKFRRPPALSTAKYGCRYGQPKPCK